MVHMSELYVVQKAPSITLGALRIQFHPPIDVSIIDQLPSTPSLIIPINIKALFEDAEIDLATGTPRSDLTPAQVANAMGPSYWNLTNTPMALTYSVDKSSEENMMVSAPQGAFSVGAHMAAVAGAILRQQTNADAVTVLFQNSASLEASVNAQMWQALASVLGSPGVIGKLLSISNVFQTPDGILDVSDIQSCNVFISVSMNMAYSVFAITRELSIKGLDACATLTWHQ